MSNKLYTEEQVFNLFENFQLHLPFHYEMLLKEYMLNIKPIELPSNDELKEFAQKICDGNQHVTNCCLIMGTMVIQKIKSKKVQ